jgi:hypothetical protein
MVHPAMHIWSLQRLPLNAEVLAELFEEVLGRQPGQ